MDVEGVVMLLKKLSWPFVKNNIFITIPVYYKSHKDKNLHIFKNSFRKNQIIQFIKSQNKIFTSHVYQLSVNMKYRINNGDVKYSISLNTSEYLEPFENNVKSSTVDDESAYPTNSTFKKNCKASSINLPSNKKFSTKKVSFSSVSIREHDITIGDHPDCAKGIPISLDWNFHENLPMEINRYEKQRVKERRKNRKNMALSDLHRKSLLFTFGYTYADLEEAKKVIEKNRRQRKLAKLRGKFENKKKNVFSTSGAFQSVKSKWTRSKFDKSAVSPLEDYCEQREGEDNCYRR